MKLTIRLYVNETNYPVKSFSRGEVVTEATMDAVVQSGTCWYHLHTALQERQGMHC